MSKRFVVSFKACLNECQSFKLKGLSLYVARKRSVTVMNALILFTGPEIEFMFL